MSAKILGKIFLVLTTLVIGMAMAGCGNKGCATATPGATGGSSGGSSGGSTPPATTCNLPGGGIGGGSPSAFAYYANSGSIGATMLDTSGNFGRITTFVPPPGTLNPIPGMVVVQMKWLYEAAGVQIQAYSINGSTGALTAITGSPFASSNTEVYSISADPAGKFLFLLGANNDQVVVYSIDQTTGGLTTLGTFATGFFAAQAATDGKSRFLYVTAGNLGGEVDVFTLGSTTVTPSPGNPFPISIAELQSEPTGKFMLGVTGNGANNGVGTDNHVYVYSIDQSTGALTPVSGSPFATTYIPATFAVHPNGTLVYTFNKSVSGSSPMEAFQLDTSSGALTALSTSPFMTMTAFSGKFDQTGAYLFLHSTDTLAVASVNTTTGALTSLGSPVTGVGSAPAWAVTDPH